MISKAAGRRFYTVKFKLDGRVIQKRTKATTQKAALAIEGQMRAELAQGNYGILTPRVIPTVGEFLRKDFLPFVANAKPNTAMTYRYAAQRLLASPLARLRLDEINSQHTAAFAAANAHRSAVTINISLRTLRRALHLAVAWGKLVVAPKFPLVQGENHRERVLSEQEFGRYLAACHQPWRDVVTLLYGTAVRPAEAYALRWEQVLLNGTGGLIQITAGKTANAKRMLPMVPAVHAMLSERHHAQGGPTEGFVFPASGKSGHILQQNGGWQHRTALRRSGVKAFPVYTMRHTALTRLAEAGCDAFTLARIAGHSSIAVTSRYCHPQAEAIHRAFAKLEAKGVTTGGYQLSGEVVRGA